MGEVQTYTMIEWVRDNFDKLAEEIQSRSAPAPTAHDEEREKVSKQQ